MRSRRARGTEWAALVWLGVLVLAACSAHRPVGPDADASRDGDVDQDAPAGDAEGDSPCLPDPDGDADVDVDVDADADADAVADADLEPDTGIDFDFEPDADLGLCPPDMVPVGRSCIDVYEASRSDATAWFQGTAGGAALSRPGVVPWHVNPMTAEALVEFEAACAAAGKRLCTPDEWAAACCGPGRSGCPSTSSYVYGDTFDRETCNIVDTFCDDHCLAEGIDPCDTGPDCGYRYFCFRVMATESFPGCTNAVGTFDINGNVWEAVPVPTSVDPRGYQLRGGAFNCASAVARVNCEYNATWTTLYAGFRCCASR